MTKKIILTTPIFSIPLFFLEQKPTKASSILRNKDIHKINEIKKNNSQSLRNFSFSKKNIFEIKSCWGKEYFASQKQYCSTSLKPLKTFDL